MRELILIKTRKNIIEAFWQLYQGKNIDKITIKELMDKAGYHRSVFYSYFRDIYDLLEQEKEAVCAELNELMPYVSKIIIDNEYDKTYFEKLENFCINCSAKIHTLTGPHGDLDFQYRMKDTIRQNVYTIFNLPTDNYKINMAVEFFINGHIYTMLYFHKHQNVLNINDYFDLIRSILEIVLKYKNEP